MFRIVIALPAILLALCAQAGEGGPYAFAGMGIANYGQAAKDFSDQSSGCACAGTYDRHASIIKAGGGYRFTENFAIEAAYFRTGKFVRTMYSAPTVDREMVASGVNMSLVGISTHENQEAHFRLGMAYWKNERDYSTSGTNILSQSDSGLDVSFGVGYTWFFAKPIGLFVDLDYYPSAMPSSTGESVSINAMSVGLKAAF